MIFDVNFIATVDERAKSQKRVSKYDSESLNTIMEYINFINSLDEDVLRINDKDFDHIMIPNEFKDLVLPKSVRIIAGDRKTKDVLVRPNSSKSESDFVKIQDSFDAFRGYFKKDGYSDIVPLSQLKVDLSITDVLDRVSIGNNARCSDGKFPIEISNVKLFEDRFLPQSVSDCVKDWMVNLKF